MNNVRIAWEPEWTSDFELVSQQVTKYMDNEATFAQFTNGSCLILKPVENINEVIDGAMREARRIADFKVYGMRDGDFLVFFAGALLVYVGKDEFKQRKADILLRKNELMFPSENILNPNSGERSEEELLVGLYARGKLQRDAWHDLKYEIIKPIQM